MADRFDDLVADLSAELDAGLAAELAAEVDERARFEFGQLRLVDRLRAGVGLTVVLRTRAGEVTGTIRTVGPDWAVLQEAPGRSALVPLAAVASAAGLGATTAVPAGVVDSRLDLRFALRRLARDRALVRLAVAAGSELSGLLGRVAADYVELDPRAPGELRAAVDGSGIRVVPLAALQWLRWS